MHFSSNPHTAKHPCKKLGILLLTLLLILLSAACKSKEKIDWAQMALGNLLPAPPSLSGTVYDNNGEELWVSLEDVSDAQYNSYLALCKEEGFTLEADETGYGYEAFDADGHHLELGHYSDGLTITLKAPMKLGTITWPQGPAGQQLPAPASSAGKFTYERADGFQVYIGNTSHEAYQDYVTACAQSGFTVDYSKDDRSYSAANDTGWQLILTYEGGSIMQIDLAAPEPETTTDTPETTAQAAETETATAETTASEATTAETTTAETTTTEAEETATEASRDFLRPEFKEAMDSYEAFMDEYVAFMKKYQDNPTDVSLLKDYTVYMSKAAEMAEAFDKWESEEMNPAEAAYYLEVQLRVNKKLLESID